MLGSVFLVILFRSKRRFK